MSSEADSWKDVIQKKIMELFKDNVDHCLRIVRSLDLEKEAYKSSNQDPPSWRTLKNALNYDGLFKAYSDQIADETKTEPKNTEYRKTLAKLIDNISKINLPPSSSLFTKDAQQSNDFVRLNSACVNSGFTGFAHAMSLIPVDAQRKILQQIPQIIADRSLVVSMGQLTGFVNRISGTLVAAALAATYLGYEAIRSIRLWWKGEISGPRCCKNIVDSAATIGGGIAGGAAGAAIGSLAGPIGTLIGGLIGAAITAEVVNTLSDRLTQAIFGVPQSVALENAYNYFGVSMSASNGDINSAYRSSCLRHHPDKGGNRTEFEIVQVHMETIKAARNL